MGYLYHKRPTRAQAAAPPPWFDPATDAAPGEAFGPPPRGRRYLYRRPQPSAPYTPVSTWFDPTAGAAPEELPPGAALRVDAYRITPCVVSWIDSEGIQADPLPPGAALESRPKLIPPRPAAYALPNPWTDLADLTPETLPPGQPLAAQSRKARRTSRADAIPWFDPAGAAPEEPPPGASLEGVLHNRRLAGRPLLTPWYDPADVAPPPEALPEGAANLATPRRDRRRVQLDVFPWSEPTPRPLYDADDVLSAVQLWYAAQTSLHGQIGKLWHIEAPEGVDPPYTSFFTAAETELDGRTTAYTYLNTIIQFSFHAETDVQASAMRRAFRKAILKAPLSVGGVPVWYVLPGDQSILIGEGFGRDGTDCWIATLDVSIPWQTDQT